MPRPRMLAIVAVVLAATCLVQGGGWNQNAHLALTRALADGTASVDGVGPTTGDLALHDGRLYSAKAPGLALAAVGPYWALNRSGTLAAAAKAGGLPRDDVDLWLLAGLAIVVEYGLAIAAAALGVYAVRAGAARGLGYAAGLAVGAAPVFAYNTLVFGGPLDFPYEEALPIAGQEANERGLYGVSWPSPGTAVELLVGGRGLLVVTPVVLVAVAALVPLYRRGWRAEALLVAGLVGAFVAYNAGYDVPLGGSSPGPRFLVALMPFLAVALALAYALWPRVTLALAVPSVVYAAGVTVTGPLQAEGWSWVTADTGHATAQELARFVPLVVAAVLLAGVATLSALRPRP